MTQDGQGLGGQERLMTGGPLIVQSDRTVLLESDHPDAAEAAIAIAPFAQLSKTPEHVHTYTITPLGLWNARASGHDAESIVDVLLDYAKHPVPHALLLDIVDVMDRWGVLTLHQSPVHGLVLESTDAALLAHLLEQPDLAGKTIVGAAAMARVSTTTLILVTNSVSAKQWKAELLRRTTLTEDEIGEYSGSVKEIRPVTIATYQVLTTRRKGSYLHLELLDARDWGLVVYDEVHLLPAPVFRLTASLQARRRLGLTATLVREDGREDEVFSLIGPKQFEVPWKEIERDGFIASATCHEIRVPLAADMRRAYGSAEGEDRYRMAATADTKVPVVRQLVAEHPESQILVIGQYIDQLEELGEALGAPVLTGKTPEREREELYADFRAGRVRVLVVSKVANFSVDLPEASVAIQVSGAFGSRQEEAQRLGRILRPKAHAEAATFYTVVTADTVDERFAGHRRRFLTEQGYAYTIETR